jgi:serine/threonine protein kinase
VGTLAYMAPEQLASQKCDARSDMFALGIVLYEMAAGRRPFGGHSNAELIAEIMRCEAAEVPNASPQFAHVVARCLAKNPDERWQSASDVKLELQWTRVAAAAPSRSVPPAESHWRLWIVAVGCLALGIVASTLWPRRRPADPVYRFTLAPPPDAEFLNAPNRTGLALSPDSAIREEPHPL